jgi:xanthine/uracil permease
MVLGFAPVQRDVTWNSWVIGVVLLIVAAGRAAAQVPKVWQEAANLVLGIWLILSPWVLEFAAHARARNSTVVAGIAVAGIALWAMLVDIDVREWMHERHLMR